MSEQKTTRLLGENHPLSMSLAAAVPLWIIQLQEYSWDEKMRIAKESEEALRRLGEAILFRTRPGESAEAFNALAKGIAVMAFCPGGVTCFGQTWDASKILVTAGASWR